MKILKDGASVHGFVVFGNFGGTHDEPGIEDGYWISSRTIISLYVFIS